MANTQGQGDGNFSAEVAAEIRRQAAQQAAKWTIAGVLAALALAATGLWLYFEQAITKRLGGVPSGAVLAFTMDCPKQLGWEPYELAAGKTIIGAGFGKDKDGKALTARKLFDEGGEEKHLLTEPEMPSHTHEIARAANEPNNSFAYYKGEKAMEGTASTGSAGEGLPHNNMPPFVALHYCIKR